MNASADLPRMWREILELSNLRAHEKVVVLNRLGGRSPYAQVAVTAAEAVAANVSYLEVEDTDSLPSTALDAIRRSQLLLDLAFSHDQRVMSFLGDGLRILVTVEPPEILARLFPTQEDKRRCVAGRQRLASASSMRVRSDCGTDFTVSLGEFRPSCQFGFSEEPGWWDQWPGAFVYTYPDERSANGTVVLDRGDILFPMKSYVQSPIRVGISNGYITSIDGGTDARTLSAIFASYRDPEVYAISHLGWGLSQNARWDALDGYDKADIEGQDGRAFYGNFLFSTGPNIHGGGKRDTPCHIDIPMRNCSLWLDGQPVVLKGAVMPEDQRSEKREAV